MKLKVWISLAVVVLLTAGVIGSVYGQDGPSLSARQGAPSFEVVTIIDKANLPLLAPITITHSIDPVTIAAANSVSCNDSIAHTDNYYYRAFNLANFGITNDFDVASVEFGIEQAYTLGASAPVDISIWSWTGGFPSGSGTLLATVTENFSNGDAGLLVQTPIVGTVPAGGELVVEIFTPDGGVNSDLIWIGSNALGETGPSYLMAPDCGVTVPTPTGSIGFPGMNIVMSVTGEEYTPPVGDDDDDDDANVVVIPPPGPDMVEIPPGCVVGTVMYDTPIYHSPWAGATSVVEVTAGKTFWVYGMDSSGQFYKVMMSGKFFWLPVSAMGPTYDEVWNGTPLPTAVTD